MSEEKPKLKVNDLIRLREQDVNQINESILRLQDLSKLYYEANDLFDVIQLEESKRRFLAELQYFTVMYSKTKQYKNDTHTYLHEIRKRVKGETFQILLSEGKKTTMANELIYCHPYYIERINLIESLIEFFIKVEYLHDFFTGLGNAIIQSISIASKEKQSSIHQ
jgi:hypothetical protein